MILSLEVTAVNTINIYNYCPTVGASFFFLLMLQMG